jgi:hypothetical protein
MRAAPGLPAHLHAPIVGVRVRGIHSGFLLWAAVAEDWMPLGGAFGCLGIAVQQWKLARKHRAAVSAARPDPSQQRPG